jgi:mono/diheme cytochrome c family protein
VKRSANSQCPTSNVQPAFWELGVGGWALTLMLVALAPVSEAQAQAPSPQSSSTAPAGSADEGKKLFVSYGCYQCHGREAQGSSSTGPRLGPRPIAFTAFSRYVRRPTGQMPPYTAKVVSDPDMANIYAYVQSRTPPPAVQSIPLLREP